MEAIGFCIGLPVRQVGRRWRDLVCHVDPGSPGGALCRVCFPPLAEREGHNRRKQMNGLLLWM